MHLSRAKKKADWVLLGEANRKLLGEANRKEVQFLWDNHTWDLVDIPARKTISGIQMVYERRRGATDAVERYKGRLVARGDTQLYGVDCQEFWAPVARYATMRALPAHYAMAGLRLAQIEVETAFYERAGRGKNIHPAACGLRAGEPQ